MCVASDQKVKYRDDIIMPHKFLQSKYEVEKLH